MSIPTIISYPGSKTTLHISSTTAIETPPSAAPATNNAASARAKRIQEQAEILAGIVLSLLVEANLHQ